MTTLHEKIIHRVFGDRLPLPKSEDKFFEHAVNSQRNQLKYTLQRYAPTIMRGNNGLLKQAFKEAIYGLLSSAEQRRSSYSKWKEDAICADSPIKLDYYSRYARNNLAEMTAFLILRDRLLQVQEEAYEYLKETEVHKAKATCAEPGLIKVGTNSLNGPQISVYKDTLDNSNTAKACSVPTSIPELIKHVNESGFIRQATEENYYFRLVIWVTNYRTGRIAEAALRSNIVHDIVVELLDSRIRRQESFLLNREVQQAISLIHIKDATGWQLPAPPANCQYRWRTFIFRLKDDPPYLRRDFQQAIGRFRRWGKLTKEDLLVAN